MALDSEAKALIARLQDFEDRLITDKILEEQVYRSVRTLERIFGKKSIFSELLRRLKTRHKVKRLDVAVRRAINQTQTSIESANASAEFPHLNVNKNSFLSDFLADTGKIRPARLREYHTFFSKFKTHMQRATLELAFEKGDPEEVKKILKEYIEMLESAEQHLRNNQHKMLSDIRYSWSLHNVMGHEVAHWVYSELSKMSNDYNLALNEAYSFALQQLMHTFESDYIFTRDNLMEEIRQLYRLIPPRKYVYEHYNFMKPFIIFTGILVICDSIARKKGDYRNRRIFLQSYSTPTLLAIYQLIEESINNLKNYEFREIIRSTLLKTAKSQLRKVKVDIINHLEENLKKLPSFEKIETIRIGRPSSWENWTDLKTGLQKLVSGNTRRFAASLDLLRIIGDEDEAKEYRDRYLKILEETIQKIMEYSEGEEKRIYQRESHTIDGVIAVIEEEERDLVEILHGLKF
ncbi:MAG: hypothetical protein IH934_04160 [Nanoarchaeota archaeon]|nr:hypothetical protein [Nanoarchaeota archaeon]